MPAFKPYSFVPSASVRNPHVQTVLSSSRLRLLYNRFRRNGVQRERILETPDGIRLLGALSETWVHPPKGIVLMLHGWEGSINSTYMRCTASRLLRHGYSVFRLNLRDHGNSHHLNKALFYASALEEVFTALKTIADEMSHLPACIVGFSLGGNFALRIVNRCRKERIANLKHAICVSPVLDPETSTRIIDRIFYIRNYFLKKWRRSLQRKQDVFPGDYDLDGILKLDSVFKVTEALLQDYSSFGSVGEYFQTYTIHQKSLKSPPVPVTLLTAEDDPIIPVKDFHRLETGSNVNVSIQRHGGHNGFIEGLGLNAWYEPEIIRLLKEGLAG